MAIFGAGRRGGANGAPDALAEAMTEPLAGAIMDAPADTAAHAPHGADGLPAPRRHAAIVAVSLGTILTTIDGSIVSVALPTLARDLHVAPSSAVLVVTIYQLVLMMTLLPFSALADRFGLRVTYQSGQIVFVVATIFCFFARSLPFLVLVRAFPGAGRGGGDERRLRDDPRHLSRAAARARAQLQYGGGGDVPPRSRPRSAGSSSSSRAGRGCSRSSCRSASSPS